VSAATLPPCPLCGSAPQALRGVRTHHPEKASCPLSSLLFSDEQWRRLASPPLAPEIVAVLRACDEYMDSTSHSRQGIVKAAWAWRKAGRPGLPETAKKEPT